ncbi:MAG: superoxide dismutase [Bacilli bacterium]|nr:superoxide dismutase [Bacilli bacterium]MCI9435083.1 superoxide dismutase [Bacilli bacterium]
MYKSISLPYNYDSLEPFLDKETINIHYNKHYLGYLNKLNNLLNSVDYDYRYSKEDLVKHIDEIPLSIRDDVLYNLGGVINHELYFYSMSDKKANIPSGTINKKIIEQFGSFNNFKKKFIETANYLVGSGYTFLIVNNEGDLEIINTSNQETPYIYDLVPIMALDLWEHAYYLLYQNRRSDYINNFFEIIDFVNINQNYEKELSKIQKK